MAHPPLERLAEAARTRGALAFSLRAFTQVYEEDHRRSALLGIARCHRDRFARTGAAEARALAIAHYHAYLATAPTPRTAKEARAAITSLRAEDATPLSEAKLQKPARASWLAITSPTPKTQARIDGHEPRPVPTFVRVSPGRHHVVLSSRDHLPRALSVSVAKGALNHMHVELKLRPAQVELAAPEGARLRVDGTFAGVAPFDGALSLAPGRRVLTVSQLGHEPRRTIVELRPGTRHDITIDLSPTPQRYGAISLFAIGGAGVATAIGLGVVAVVKDTAAGQSNEQSERSRLEGSASDYRLGAALAAGGGFAAWTVGGALFLFDDAPVAVSPGPGLVGGAVSARF